MDKQTGLPSQAAPVFQWPFKPLGRKSFLLAGVLLLLAALFPFWGSIAVAAVFSLGLSRPTEKLAYWLGNRKRLASSLIVSALVVLVLFPASFFGVRIIQFFTEKNGQSPADFFSPETRARISALFGQVRGTLVRYGVGSHLFDSGGDAQEAFRQGASSLLKQIAAAFSSALASVPELVLSTIVFAIFLYVFLSYPAELLKLTLRMRIFHPADLKRSITILKASSYNSLVANFLVGIVQASIITGGAAAVGYSEPVLIFTVVFFLSYIPFIGTAPVGYLLGILSLVTDGISPALLMAGVATFAGLIDNFLRPILVASGKVNVHPVLSFAAIIGAILVFGLKGMFLGPVILTGTVALLGAGGINGKKEGGEKILESAGKPPEAGENRIGA